jgi:hypothetical protein
MEKLRKKYQKEIMGKNSLYSNQKHSARSLQHTRTHGR